MGGMGGFNPYAGYGGGNPYGGGGYQAAYPVNPYTSHPTPYNLHPAPYTALSLARSPPLSQILTSNP